MQMGEVSLRRGQAGDFRERALIQFAEQGKFIAAFFT